MKLSLACFLHFLQFCSFTVLTPGAKSDKICITPNQKLISPLNKWAYHRLYLAAWILHPHQYFMILCKTLLTLLIALLTKQAWWALWHTHISSIYTQPTQGVRTNCWIWVRSSAVMLTNCKAVITSDSLLDGSPASEDDQDLAILVNIASSWSQSTSWQLNQWINWGTAEWWRLWWLPGRPT